MPQVGPDEDEEREVGSYQWGAEVVEQFGSLYVLVVWREERASCARINSPPGRNH